MTVTRNSETTRKTIELIINNVSKKRRRPMKYLPAFLSRKKPKRITNAGLRLLLSLTLIGTFLSTEVTFASVQDCMSQEDCFVLLKDNEVNVYRKDVLKGKIEEMQGDGTISASNGWIITTHTMGVDIYIHELATGITCTRTIDKMCDEAIVLMPPDDPTQNRAFLVCPYAHEYVGVELDCSNHFAGIISGLDPRSITLYGEDRFLVSLRGTQEIMGYTNGMGWYTPFPVDNMEKIRYWNNQIDPPMIFVNADSTIYWQETDTIPHGLPPVFYELPQGIVAGSMSVNDTHLLAAPLNDDGVYLIEINNPTSHTVLPVRTPYRAEKTPTFTALTANLAVMMDKNNTIEGYSLEGDHVFSFNAQVHSIAYLAPTEPPECGNNLVEPGETCDGTDFDGITCENYGFDGGSLLCSTDCSTIFASQCWSCGDGVINTGEECDGTNIGEATCQDMGFESGELSCTDECMLDYSSCYTCGNGLIEGPEECEGADLNEETCASLGFVDGSLSCGEDCTFDTNQCHMCGNNITDEGELCDGTDTPGMICQTMGLGYTSGSLECNSSCDEYDDTNCWSCGDSIANEGEECDGNDLKEMTCGTLGLGEGTLSCFANCTFNISECDDAPVEYCGNGVVDPGEECDDGDRSNTDDPAPGDTLRCSENCKLIPATCGVGSVDPGEDCDGENLNGETCQTLGYQTGVLYCGTDCKFRTEDCGFDSGSETISLMLNAEPESGELDTSLQAEFDNLKKSLTSSCLSQDVEGDLVISTEPGSYCTVRATTMDQGFEKSVFDVLFIPENPLDEEPPILRIYSNGGIAQNYGGHLTAHRGLDITTVLVHDQVYQVSQSTFASIGIKFVRINPDTQVVGNWVGFKGELDSFIYCEDPSSPECGFVPGKFTNWNYINLNNFFESLVTTRKQVKSSGCNATRTRDAHNIMLLLLVVSFALIYYMKSRKKR